MQPDPGLVTAYQFQTAAQYAASLVVFQHTVYTAKDKQTPMFWKHGVMHAGLDADFCLCKTV